MSYRNATDQPDAHAPGVVGDLASTLAESMRGLDDAQLIEARGFPACKEAADFELASRRNFEVAWSGQWSAGPRMTLQPRLERLPRLGPHPCAQRETKRQQRDRDAKLIFQSRSPNRAERAAALFLLKSPG